MIKVVNLKRPRFSKKPYAESECKILLVEPKGVVNTGQERADKIAENDVWI